MQTVIHETVAAYYDADGEFFCPSCFTHLKALGEADNGPYKAVSTGELTENFQWDGGLLCHKCHFEIVAPIDVVWDDDENEEGFDPFGDLEEEVW